MKGKIEHFESHIVPSFRRRLEQSTLLANIIAWIFGVYLRFCNLTTRWEVQGLQGLQNDLANGPILLVMWHERLLMGAIHWPLEHGQLSSLYSRSPIGRIAGAMHRQMGLRPMEMSNRLSNIAASRTVLKRVREGISIGMAADGPTGPANQVKDAPLEWARIMQRPVYAYAFAVKRQKKLQSWDRMIMPLPFTKGIIVFTKWDHEIPRKSTQSDLEQGRAAMAALLNDASQQADQYQPQQ